MIASSLVEQPYPMNLPIEASFSMEFYFGDFTAIEMYFLPKTTVLCFQSLIYMVDFISGIEIFC